MEAAHVPDSLIVVHTVHTMTPKAISGEIDHMNLVPERHPNQCHDQCPSHALPLLTHLYCQRCVMCFYSYPYFEMWVVCSCIFVSVFSNVLVQMYTTSLLFNYYK